MEATRSRSRREREEFSVFRTSAIDLIQGNGVKMEVLYADVVTLVDAGLVQITNYHSHGSGFGFFVPPRGFQFYEELKQHASEPAGQIESDTIRYLNDDRFRDYYPDAYAFWKEASDLLWGADSDRELSTIGHKCREAVQAFATALLEREGITEVTSDATKTRDRLSGVLIRRHDSVGEKTRVLLDRLFEFWIAACDFVQRQEHAGQREKERLRWEDGRRVVFQTAVVMFEIDRTLN